MADPGGTNALGIVANVPLASEQAVAAVRPPVRAESYSSRYERNAPTAPRQLCAEPGDRCRRARRRRPIPRRADSAIRSHAGSEIGSRSVTCAGLRPVRRYPPRSGVSPASAVGVAGALQNGLIWPIREWRSTSRPPVRNRQAWRQRQDMKLMRRCSLRGSCGFVFGFDAMLAQQDAKAVQFLAHLRAPFGWHRDW